MKHIQKYSGVMACIMANQAFSLYSEGIFDHTEILKQYLHSNEEINWSLIDHAIYIYGWGYNKKTKQYFWNIANSWGNDWGDNGRGFVLMGNNIMGIETHLEWV